MTIFRRKGREVTPSPTEQRSDHLINELKRRSAELHNFADDLAKVADAYEPPAVPKEK